VMAAAMLESPVLLSPVALVIAILSVFFADDVIFDPASAVARPVFIMATALFYWYVVGSDRGRDEASPPERVQI